MDGGWEAGCGRSLLFDGRAVGDEGGVDLLPGKGGSVHRLVQVDTAAAVSAGPGSNSVVDRVAVVAEREGRRRGIAGRLLTSPRCSRTSWECDIARPLLLLRLLGCWDVRPSGSVVARHRARVVRMGKGSRGVDSRALECGWVVVVEVGRGDKVGGVEGLLVMVVGMVHRVEAGRVAQG